MDNVGLDMAVLSLFVLANVVYQLNAAISEQHTIVIFLNNRIFLDLFSLIQVVIGSTMIREKQKVDRTKKR